MAESIAHRTAVATAWVEYGDTRTISSLVGAISTEIMPTRGGSLAAGLDKARALLRQTGVRSGDVLRVTITVDASAERNWVVVDDPIPAGATIIGDLANQSQMLGEGGDSDGVQPSYIERGNDSWRGFFAWVPRGRFTVSYALRLNGAGRFSLPPTRVEAMYSPSVRAQVPNQPVVVGQR